MPGATVTCRYCGSTFRKGWQLSRHMKACFETSVSLEETSDEGTDAGEDELLSEHSDGSSGTGQDVGGVRAEDAVVGLGHREERQPAHRVQHCLSPKIIETIRDLGSMCRGLPVADEKVKEILKYTRSLNGPTTHYLPKTPQTAWRRLAKVRTKGS